MPSLEFKGKQFIYTHHLSVPFRELVPDKKKSVAPQVKGGNLNDNLIIHGDNLEALKALLPTYAGKVDCIFIDPPYNTGNEGWCYNDKVNSPLMREWLKKEANPVDKEDLERHDKWLCMMWPRLKLLHELLAETGSIWITLDDNEVHRARMVLDEIFGADRTVAQMVWQKRTSRENRATFSSSHDHILVYTKGSTEVWKSYRNLLDPGENGYANLDNDDRGEWTSVPFSAQGHRDNQVYDIKTPSGRIVKPPRGRCWGATESVFEQLKRENRIYFPRDGDGLPRIKQFKDEAKGLVPSTLWLASEVGDNEDSKKEIMEIFDEDQPFDTPKPVGLLSAIVQIATKQNALVLDSFAGSGTTAHAVLAMNQKDGGNRRFILIECEDYADKLTAERVRRVIGGYSFTGTQRTELMREKLTLTMLKKAGDLLEKANSISKLEGASYDRVLWGVKDGMFSVIGEKDVKEKTEGLGGSFTYCTLGKVMDLETIVRGEGELPDYDSLARYVFFTATGRALDTVPKRAPDGFIGATDLYNLHLHYQPERAWLRGGEAQLHEDHVKLITARKPPGKKALVFAVGKYMSQKTLTPQGVEFCQLPYAIHRMVGG